MKSKQAVDKHVVLDLTKRGINEDWDRNYEEAARLYEECEVYFNHTIEHELVTDYFKNLLRLKCKQYTDRAKRLRLHLEECKRIKEEKKRIEKLGKLQCI